MVSTQVQLDPQHYDRLKRQAEAEQKSVSDKIREAVEVYLGSQNLTDPKDDVVASDKPRLKPIEQLRSFDPLPPEEQDDLKDHDRWWTDTIR